MLRYMICPVIGSGADEDAFRAAVADLSQTNAVAVIPTHPSGPNIGQPKYSFALCAVSSNNWLAVLAVSNSYVFPVYNLDGRMDGMEAATRTAMVQSVEAYNLDGEGLHLVADHNDGDSYRSLMQSLLHQFEPAYNFDGFSVAEVTE